MKFNNKLRAIFQRDSAVSKHGRQDGGASGLSIERFSPSPGPDRSPEGALIQPEAAHATKSLTTVPDEQHVTTEIKTGPEPTSVPAPYALETLPRIERASKLPSANASYQYKPLGDASSQIRLLRFDASIHPVEIRVQLATFVLAKAPAYTALSYAWGEPGERPTIFIDRQIVPVQPSCRVALEQLQHHLLTEWYWIDAICINQNDAAEKGPQVGLMAQIFKRAEQVAVSYGVATQRTDWLMGELTSRFANSVPDSFGLRSEVMHWLDENCHADTIDDWRNCDCLERREKPSGTLQWCLMSELASVLQDVGKRPYWTRLWVVQELAHARAVVLLSSSACIPLHRFVTFAWSFAHALHAVSIYESTSARKRLAREFWFSVPMFQLTHRIYGIRYPTNEVKTTRFTLADLINRYEIAHCTIPLDKIYALLGMIVWRRQYQSVAIDYTISILELAKRVLVMQDSFWECLSPACMLIWYLNLTPETCRILEMSRERWDKCNACVSRQKHLASPPPAPRTVQNRDYLAAGWSCTLFAPETGGLQVAAELKAGHDVQDPLPEPSVLAIVKCLEQWASECCSQAPRHAPLNTLFHGQQRIGIACGGAQDGDHLLRIALSSDYGSYSKPVHVILRAVGDIFVFIGYAVVNHKYSLIARWPGLPEQIPEDRSPILNFDVEDLLAMAYLYYGRNPAKLGPDKCQEWYAEVLSTRISRFSFSSHVSLLPRSARKFRINAGSYGYVGRAATSAGQENHVDG